MRTPSDEAKSLRVQRNVDVSEGVLRTNEGPKECERDEKQALGSTVWGACWNTVDGLAAARVRH